ncbi:bifunctional alpha/beta hydrolase/OsmC family protein [Marinobacter caseinilyticus]|uniref:bifunctional alpha/beta hydrolase/OsmC family protein n=1 Tax=Marinobacter caseinilyticus TaxID=2692195 RepID=UPI00140DA51C|nr:bifunctional alpha/beta hydrolase/OsmC family protein [Marinobacter caseinilyticus]
MARIKVEFPNDEGNTLAGLLELPENSKVRAVALFAHCFTCGKDVVAASRISRALAGQGIGVLRFDFTGLGNSDGDFANTNFSSNIEDLIAAARYLEQAYEAPKLIIGHSLGGAAALVAAQKLDCIEAVATIAAPATAHHVQQLFSGQEADIRAQEQARVSIGGREFSIKSQLLDDLEHWNSPDHIARLRKPLIIFHSPVDRIVDINEAAAIFQAAKHPKSFISLDSADHLLSKPEDSQYVALTLVAWASRYLTLKDTASAAVTADLPALDAGQVLITEKDAKFLRGLYTNDHQLLADEPQSVGGTNLGPNPYDLLLMSLGACTSMTLRMYANRKSLPITNIEVRLQHSRVHADDCEQCESTSGQIDRIERVISYQGDLDAGQEARLLQIADLCPVHKTLHNEIDVVTHLD